MSDSHSSLLRADALSHRGGPEELRDLSFTIPPARIILISGAGATLLLRILGLTERPLSGELWFDSQPTSALDDAARLELRNQSFAYLFSEPFLLDSFSVAENIAMPLFKVGRLDLEQARMRTAQVLDFTGLAAHADSPVADLSMLDQHKVSLARALAAAPRVVIAENAGAHLAGDDHRDYLDLLRAAPAFGGATLIATSSHPAETLAPPRELRLDSGSIIADTAIPTPAQKAPAPTEQ